MNKAPEPIYKIYADKYVAAVIQGTVKMAIFLQRVPQRTLKRLKVEPISGNYPFVLIEAEKDGKRIFIACGEHKQEISSIKTLCANNAFKVLTTYAITEDFFGDPTSPGLDYMGALDHEHEEENG